MAQIAEFIYEVTLSDEGSQIWPQISAEYNKNNIVEKGNNNDIVEEEVTQKKQKTNGNNDNVEEVVTQKKQKTNGNTLTENNRDNGDNKNFSFPKGILRAYYSSLPTTDYKKQETPDNSFKR